MTEIEKEIIQDEKLLELILSEFKKINKIKADKIDAFIEQNQEELDKISKGRNWKVWLLSRKKKYKQLIKKKKEDKEDKKENKKENKKKKSVLQLDDGNQVIVESLSPENESDYKFKKIKRRR